MPDLHKGCSREHFPHLCMIFIRHERVSTCIEQLPQKRANTSSNLAKVTVLRSITPISRLKVGSFLP